MDIRKVQVHANNYTMYKGRLYKKGYSNPLMKCVTLEEARQIFEEIHVGVFGGHVGSREVV